ncbi:epoxyqueuosine reductase QueH [Pelovirga terrestris]|uniref:Epoxyqueuosine reductase QueH n=1 Tax=Pelovirga terrestris TaxID=2771352 RepID=A0A8J6QV97_9BACT|nr:epoxyqueuosine reductase QueH [Pelovirga terrestris]MBD1401435.1 epoxyqueuosine reductase QueH [Pelovirga terrestris]
MNILLHICCANCAIYPVTMLRQQEHEVTGFFYNHNIHPYQEFRKRLDTTREYAGQVELPLLVNDNYHLDEFLAQVASKPEERCKYCYQSRLRLAAEQAHKIGAEAFTTTLLYSRYQQHDAIVEYGRQLATEFRLTFFYEDYRRGWNEGIRISKQMGLYRQQYCGCIYSERDRYAG